MRLLAAVRAGSCRLAGLVLGGAMIALGVHRLALILRAGERRVIALRGGSPRDAAGALIAFCIAGMIGTRSGGCSIRRRRTCRGSPRDAESELERLVGSIIVVFSPEIASAHMMALAVKLARGERSDLLAVYVIEVPYTLPPDAEMADEERQALDALGAAETIANNNNVKIRTETIKARSTKQAVLDLAKREKANLIILGSFREGKYSGAPLGRTIEEIAADAKCDVLIGVEGKHGTLLIGESANPARNRFDWRKNRELKRSFSFTPRCGTRLVALLSPAGARRKLGARDRSLRASFARSTTTRAITSARGKGQLHARPRLSVLFHEAALRQDADSRGRR